MVGTTPKIWRRHIANSSINFDWFEFSILNPLKSIRNFFLVPNETQPSPFCVKKKKTNKKYAKCRAFKRKLGS